MKTNVPGSLFHHPASWVDPLDYATVFERPQPVEVEIGAGDGSFLLQYAAGHPELNLIGVERLFGRISKIDRKGRRAGLTHLRVMRVQAEYFVQYLLPLGSVRAFHIYFPDPWPKKKHFKKRLIQSAFVTSLSRALEPGGVVYLRTDNLPYFEWMQEVFAGDVAFQAVETPAGLKALITDFERDFNAAGIPTNYAAYRLTAGSTGS